MIAILCCILCLSMISIAEEKSEKVYAVTIQFDAVKQADLLKIIGAATKDGYFPTLIKVIYKSKSGDISLTDAGVLLPADDKDVWLDKMVVQDFNSVK